MAMSLSIVTEQLGRYAAAAAAKASRANDPDSILALNRAAAEFASLQAAIQASIVELAGYRAEQAKRASRARGKGSIGALEFWHMHGQAVDAIRAVYGDLWRIKAPFGETELVQVPACWRSYTTERGTKLKWSADQRMPAAAYWPSRVMPKDLTVVPDYPRHTAASPAEHDAAWHRTHGYVLCGKTWINGLLVQSQLAHEDGIVLERAAKEAERQRVAEAKRVRILDAAALVYGPQVEQPFADIEDDLALAEAAD